MNPTHGGYGGTELRSQPSAEAPPAEPGEPVEEEEGAETGQSAAAKSPLLRALMHVKWATLLQKAGKYERATEHFRSSLELLPSARAHFGLGTCLGALRLRREAAEELRRAVQLCPSMVGAIINLAGVQLGLGDFAEAERLCREALRLEPDSREATMNLANALRNLGRRDEERSSAAAAADAPPDAVLVCLKWGQRYDAAYVNRLCAAASRQLPSTPRCVCFTESPEGIDASIEVRELPEKFHLWWGKAYLFSEEAGLDGKRVLFLDLDQVIVGSLEPLASYRGPFALLRTDGIACELAEGGYNSSVISWTGGPFWRPLFQCLTPSVLRYVHRFDHWLEMMLKGADVWQQIAPGKVVDYTTVFRAGVCLGADDDDGAFAAGAADDAAATTAAPAEPPEGCAIVTFPRSPKPHEVLEEHRWIRTHWGDVLSDVKEEKRRDGLRHAPGDGATCRSAG
ncbi:unnamed protein product [Durusdinium trenchii]|uniref:Protein O-GlcNAc transferase n=1 Tax=Durusdinium trenchii TaxID=1381693 RepID=A0ABP0KDK3_9DINO